MEIIKRGKPPQDDVFNGTCQHCKTEVRFKRAEAITQYDMRNGEYVYVHCPVCAENEHYKSNIIGIKEFTVPINFTVK